MHSNSTLLTIGITGLNAHDNPGPGIAVIRALRDYYQHSIKIIGLAYESLEPGIYLKDMVNHTYQIPYPTEGATALLGRIAEIHLREKLDLIIPNFDAELHNFIKIADQLQSIGIKTFLPTMAQLASRDKINLTDFAATYNFKTPAVQLLHTAEELDQLHDSLEYPLVIKGKFYEAQMVDSVTAAKKSFYDLSAKWGLPVIAQQFIKGTEFNVAGLGDGGGNTISVVPMRKLYITDKGKAWAGVTIDDDALVEMGKHFATAVKWKGGFELEIIKDSAGELYILEINPRFPAWIYLAAAAGQNQPLALVKMAFGENVEAYSNYESGKLFIRYSWDEIIDISKFQQFSAFGELFN